MRYTIQSVSKKTTRTNAVLLDINAHDVEGNEVTGTIWEIDTKTGSRFPNFDGLREGVSFEANAWASPTTGKITFYPPKPPTAQSGAPRGGINIAKAQEVKRTDIKEAQERKSESIAIAGAMRDATLITLGSLKDQPFPTEEEFKTEWKRWANWLLKQNGELGDVPFID